MDQGDAKKGMPYPKIIYASRTHSQLSQVIKYNYFSAAQSFLLLIRVFIIKGIENDPV